MGMNMNIIDAQQAVIALLKHFGVETKLLRSVTISASHKEPVTVNVEYIVFGKDGMPTFADRKYLVTGVADIPVPKGINAWNKFFELVNHKP